MENQQFKAGQKLNKKSNLVSIVLTVVTFLALGKYLIDNRDVLSSLQHLNFVAVLELILLYFFFILALSYLNKIVIQKLDPNIGTIEIISLQFVNNLLNKIIPKGGVAFRAMYLKKHYRLSFSYFLAFFSGLVVVNLASQALISLGATYIIYLETGLYNVIMILGFLAVLFGSFGIVVFKPVISSESHWLIRGAKRFADGWKMIVEKPKDVVYFIVISVVVLLIDALSIYLVFYALGTPIQYSVALILSSISQILSYINITPDGLGVREGVYLYISSIIAVTEPQLLFGSLIQRAVSLLAAMIFGFIGYLLLAKPGEAQQSN